MALTALVVSADPKAVEVLRRILQDLGIGVEHCEEHSVAVTKLALTAFDAVILDYQDEDSAAKTLAAMRSAPHNKTTMAIAMADVETNIREIFTRGVNFVLYKPISTERAKNSLRAARAMMRRERRRHSRQPIHAEVNIDCANIENALATLIDLSEEGTAIQCERRLPPSCKVYFQFNLPGQVTTVRLSGEVVWQDSTGRVGIRFAGVPQASRRVLNTWLQTGTRDQQAPETVVAELPAAPGGFGLLPVSAADRRIQSRHACRLSADVYRMGVNVPNRCSLSDLSSGGCYVESPSPFPIGTLVEIVVRTREMKLVVRGAVQATHPGFGMGVRFNLKSANERDNVQTLIALLAESESSEPGIVTEPWVG